MVEAIGTAKTGMQEGLNKVLPQEEGEPLLVFLMSQCYCISSVVSQNKKLVHKVFPQKAVFEMRISCFKLVGFDKIWRDSLYPDHFYCLKKSTSYEKFPVDFLFYESA